MCSMSLNDKPNGSIRSILVMEVFVEVPLNISKMLDDMKRFHMKLR